MNKEAYQKLLQDYLDNGFTFVFFGEYNARKKKQIILRHDVDFDVVLALQMAEIEQKMGIKASYFFLTHSDVYNFNGVPSRKFRELGHYVGLHVDYTEELIPDDMKMQQYYSIHRPDKKYLGSNDKFSTYNKKFFKKMEYCSDSRCKLPKTIEKNGQLLIHPLWWILEGDDITEKLEELKKHKANQFQYQIEQNITLPEKKDPEYTCEP